MCGICGIVYEDRSRTINPSKIVAMTDSLTHRGPDDSGHYLDSGIALGSRRLKILDLSDRGHMPLETSDGRYHIIYNGEVYNYQELREGLEARGYIFRSNTDTEVIVNLYADQGPEMLNRLNGMFAFAIWDSQERVLFLARDRMGVKPLYYGFSDGAMFFASEEKALFAAGISPKFDSGTWEELLCFRYVAGERTPFVGIKRLLPGHCLLWKDGDLQIQRWWNLAERAETLRETCPLDPFNWFRETFDSAVNLRRISDVPVGVLLSGGLDSSSVAASLADQAGSGVASFTVRFAEQGYDEGPLARQVADRWNLAYHDLELNPDRLISLLRTASWLNDEPLAHGNDQHLLAISRYARSRVTVLLSGEGADETLGGYMRYQPLRYPFMLKAARSFLPALSSTLNLNGRMRKLSRFLNLDSVDRFVLFNSCDILPADLESLGMAQTGRFAFRERVLAEAKTTYEEPVRQAMYSDQHTFLCSILDRNDRMTMGASIECRVPFLDFRLVEILAALPTPVLFSGKRTKRVLRRAVGDRLPESIISHRKWGFSVPWGDYLRNCAGLRDLVNDLPNHSVIKGGPFDSTRLKSLVSRFLNGDAQSEALVKQLIMVAVWHDACFNQQHTVTAKSAQVMVGH